jgi:phosphate/sulfate permease
MLNTLGAFIGGTIGWYVGAPVGTGTAFVLSMVGTAVGVYFAKTLKARLGA